MEKKRNIIQVYAIIVNVVAIITFLISATSLISAMIDRSDPLYTGSYSKVDLSSFEKYKMDVLKSTQKDDAFIPTDKQIRDMFEAAKTDKINKVLHTSFRTIVVSSVIIGVCIILFGFHWSIVQKYQRIEVA